MRRYAVAFAALVFGLPAFAADKIPDATQDFIDKAAVANQFELDTSKLALKYGKANDVTKFAQDMIADHTKIGDEFKATLKSANIAPPGEGLDVTHQAKYAKLRVFTTEKGFDASYISEQLAAH
jgi:putative membrane protein